MPKKQASSVFISFFIILIVIFAVVLAYALFVEPFRIVVTNNEFDLFEGKGQAVKIVLISDTQTAYDYSGHLERVVEMVNAQDADLVLLAGDITDGEERGWEKLGPLSSIKSKYGTYAVLGNHDYRVWACGGGDLGYASLVEERLKGMGIEVLRNEHRILEIKGSKFALAGLEDLWACRNDYGKAAEGLAQTMPKIMLVHNQEAILNETFGPKTLILAGHTHCGQVWIPFITENMIKEGNYGRIGKGRADISENVSVYVTCGVTPGTIRLFTNPEISVITLN